MTAEAVPAGSWRADGGEGGGYGQDGGWWQLAQQVPGRVWLIAAGVLLVLLVVVLVWLRHLWRRSRRQGLLRPDRVGRALLAVQAQSLPGGPARDAAALRLRLDTELAATRAGVAAAAAAGVPVDALTSVLGRLQDVAAGVDGRLRALQSEPDAAHRAAGLAVARPAAEQVLTSAGRIRSALSGTRMALDQPSLDAVRREVDDEVGALTAYTQAFRELGGGRA